VLIPNLICGFLSPGGTSVPGTGYYGFPLYIPRGSSIGARWQSITVSPASTIRPRVAVTVFGGPSKPGFWFGTKVTGIGTDTANSAGLDINPGSTGTYSAWVSIGGTTNPKFGFVIIGAQGSVTTHTADAYHVQYGYGSTQIPGALTRFVYNTSENIYTYPRHSGCYVDVPEGTQLQVRATGSDATSEDPSVALYGVS
jgi:hypothetical protein